MSSAVTPEQRASANINFAKQQADWVEGDVTKADTQLAAARTKAQATLKSVLADGKVTAEEQTRAKEAFAALETACHSAHDTGEKARASLIKYEGDTRRAINNYHDDVGDKKFKSPEGQRLAEDAYKAGRYVLGKEPKSIELRNSAVSSFRELTTMRTQLDSAEKASEGLAELFVRVLRDPMTVIRKIQ